MMEVLVSLAVIVCGLILAMSIKSKKEEKRMTKEAIANLRESQRRSRFRKWAEAAKEWKIERDKPVKVQFD
jgi:hypothetical protein